MGASVVFSSLSLLFLFIFFKAPCKDEERYGANGELRSGAVLPHLAHSGCGCNWVGRKREEEAPAVPFPRLLPALLEE